MSHGFSGRLCAVLAGLALALGCLANPAAAESHEKKEDEWVAKWSNGHKIEKGKQFKLKFGGRIQADYQFASGDDALGAGNFEDGFEFRRARLFFSGTIYDKVEFKAQYDFTGQDVDMKDVWIGLKQSWGKVKFGHFKEPFSLEELTSSKYLAFLERSLPNAFAPGRNSGIGFEGGDDKFNWGFGYFYEAGDDGVSIDEDQTNITGRVVFRPVYEDQGKRLFHIGLGVTQKDLPTGGRFRFRARPEAHLTGRLVNTDRFDADSALIYGLELAGVNDRFWFAGEYITNDVDAPAFGDPSFDSYYVQAGYYLTQGDYRRYKTSSGAFDRQKPSSVWDKSGGTGAWELALRFSSIDLTDGAIAGGEEDNITVGVNWYLNPATRLMFNYVMADVDGVGDGDFILVRWQVDF